MFPQRVRSAVRWYAFGLQEPLGGVFARWLFARHSHSHSMNRFGPRGNAPNASRRQEGAEPPWAALYQSLVGLAQA
jgi:hypothetical protein